MTVKDLLMTYEGNMDYIMMFAPAENENETMDETMKNGKYMYGPNGDQKTMTIKCLGHRIVSKFTTDKNSIYIRLKK